MWRTGNSLSFRVENSEREGPRYSVTASQSSISSPGFSCMAHSCLPKFLMLPVLEPFWSSAS